MAIGHHLFGVRLPPHRDGGSLPFTPTPPDMPRAPPLTPHRHVSWLRGAAHIRDRERIRSHLHLPRPAPAVARRGRALPLPPGRLVGAVLERLSRKRRPPVSRRRFAPG